jgi:hypothetical protein
VSRFPGAMGAVPGTVGRVPGAMGRVPGAMGRVPGAMGRVPGTMGRVPGTMGAVPGTVGGVPGTMGRAPDAMGRVPGTMGAVPGAMGRVLDAMGGAPGTVGSAPGTMGDVRKPRTTKGIADSVRKKRPNSALRRQLSRHCGFAAAQGGKACLTDGSEFTLTWDWPLTANYCLLSPLRTGHCPRFLNNPASTAILPRRHRPG